MSLGAGDTLGPYEILELIGSGGMGEVYKARDTRLDRIVAIKVLKGTYSNRFDSEARAIAALNHPHICALYDIGPNYLVMEYIDGKSIEGPLSLDVTLRLATQIADALQAAHRRGIIHRDLKPANVLVTADGQVKLVDFGVAKLMAAGDATQTIEGTVLGTSAYMSPEQAQGKPADARSDIFSFGAILYEMLSGHRAFLGHTSAQALSAVLRDEPGPLADAPHEFESIIKRCLRKDPAARFASITDVKAALEKLQSAPLCTALEPSIAVLPFANLSADKENEYFSDGLAEEIINALTGVQGLKVTARTSAFSFRGRDEDVRKIGETLNVRYVLEGSVRRSGSRIRVAAQLINATDGYHLWSDRFDREMIDVFVLQDEISRAIVDTLKLKLGTPGQYLPKLDAYHAYLRGRYHFFKYDGQSLAHSREDFERAIALDPAYALAYAGLANYYYLCAVLGLKAPSEVMPASREAAQKALALDNSLQEAHAALGVVASSYDHNWEESARHFQFAMAREPVPPFVRHRYALYYLLPLGRGVEAVAQVERALEADPLSAALRNVLCLALDSTGQSELALEEWRKALEIDDTFWLVWAGLGITYTNLKQVPQAIAALETAHRLAPWCPWVACHLAALCRYTGDNSGADRILEELQSFAHPDVVWSSLTMLHTLCSEFDDAADALEKAIEVRDPLATAIAWGPLYAGFRNSPRWPELARKMNLPGQ